MYPNNLSMYFNMVRFIAWFTCAELIYELEKNTYIEPTKTTFGEFFIDYMNNDVKQSVRLSTYNLHMFMANKHILPELAQVQLQNISPLLVQRLCSKKLSGRSNRVITIPESAIKSLRTHKMRQTENKLKLGSAYQDHDLIVCYKTGNPIDPSDLNREMRQITQQLNLPYIRFHDLRHGHATQLLAMGENIKVISERLGHSSITTTLDTYTHVLPNMQEQLANKFDQAFKSQKASDNK